MFLLFHPLKNVDFFNNMETILKSELTVKEIETVVKGLKNKKGLDNIPAECFKQDGKVFLQCLAMLYNLIISAEYVPLQFKRGMIVPILKGDKDKTIKDSYRGITLLPVIAKVFEKCVIIRLEKWCQLKEVINVQQGATHDNCSSMHVAWLVKECIAKYVDAGHTVYTCLLDTKKAYDSVWQDGLFYTLITL